jgi:hypothetical protein
VTQPVYVWPFENLVCCMPVFSSLELIDLCA